MSAGRSEGPRAKAKRGGPVVRLSDVLDGAHAPPVLLTTFSWWERAVPPRVAKAARPVHLGRGTLVVHTKSAAWAQELSFLSFELLRSIQEHVPRARVERIRFRVGPLPARPALDPIARPPRVTPLRVAELPPEVARALAHVGDGELREALSKAARTSLAAAPARRRPKGEAGRRGARSDPRSSR